MKKLIEILNNSGVDTAAMSSAFNAIVAKHEAEIVKALEENKEVANGLPPMAVILTVLSEKEGIDINVLFPNDKDCTEEAAELKGLLGVKDSGFNWKKAVKIFLGVATVAGITAGGVVWHNKRKSSAAESAVSASA